MEKWIKTTIFATLFFIFAGAVHAQEPADSAKAEADTIKYSVNLGDVEVRASNVTHKADRDIYAVTPEMKKGIRSAGELLSRVNGVIYNPMTTDISYLGSKNVMILLDSVPKSAQYIKKLSPDRFDRIEVINYPTGQYLGYDVLINFHTRPAYQGYESNLQSSVWLSPERLCGRDRMLRMATGYADFTFTKEKWTLSAYVNEHRENEAASSSFERIYTLNDLRESSVIRPRKDPSEVGRGNNLTTNAAIDYEIDKRQSVSLQWVFTDQNMHSGEFQQLMTENLKNGTTELVDYRKNRAMRNARDHNISAFYRGRFGTWNVNASGGFCTQGSDATLTVERSNGYYLADNRRNDRHYFWGYGRIDKFIGQKWSVSLNGNFVATNAKQYRLGTDALLTDLDNTFGNLIAMFQFVPNRKVNLSVGAGASFYHSSDGGKDVDKVTPTAYGILSWVPSQNFVFRANYNMYFELTDENTITDYGTFTDSLTYQMGNPLLKPSLIHHVKTNFTFFNQLTLTAGYTHESDANYNIATSRVMDGRPVVYYQYQNGTSDYLMFGLNYTKSFRFGLDLSAYVQQSYIKASYGGLSESFWRPNGELSLSYRNPKLFNAYLSYQIQRYMTATPQSRKWGNSEQTSLTLSRNFFGNRLSMQMSWWIPVHLIGPKTPKTRFVSPGLTSYSVDSGNYYNRNFVALTVSYRFSGGDRVKRYDRNVMGR